MKYLGYAFRFLTNFVFLAIAYFSLNFMDKYPQRATVAALFLVFAAMRAVLGAALVLFLPARRTA